MTVFLTVDAKFKHKFSFKDMEVGAVPGASVLGSMSEDSDPYDVGTMSGTSGWNTRKDYLDF